MFSKTVAERTRQGQRQDIEEQGKPSPFPQPPGRIPTLAPIHDANHHITSFTDFTFHVYARTQSIAGVIISDKEYPSLAAHQILSKTLDEFLAQNPNADSSRNPVTFPALRTYITTYQDPQQVDSIMKIQKELDETKIVLHKTIESVRVPRSCVGKEATANDDRCLGSRTRREDRRPGHQERGSQRTEQDVLHFCKEAELLLRHLLVCVILPRTSWSDFVFLIFFFWTDAMLVWNITAGRFYFSSSAFVASVSSLLHSHLCVNLAAFAGRVHPEKVVGDLVPL